MKKDKRDILIRLLLDGHISRDEFKLLYDEPEREISVGSLGPIYRDFPSTIMRRPEMPWFGVLDPITNEPIGPTFADKENSSMVITDILGNCKVNPID